jgi:hypothetical protein
MILDLPENQVAYILQALAFRPFNEVAALIPEIQRQAQSQLAPPISEVSDA